jgi:hypothetical protein
MWEPGRSTTLWAFTACYEDSFYLNNGYSVTEKMIGQVKNTLKMK